MSKFITHVGNFFARWAYVPGFEYVDRHGVLILNGTEVRRVDVNDNRTITILDVEETERTFDRDDFMHALWHSGIDGVSFRVGGSFITFRKTVSEEAMRELTGMLYDFD